MRSVPFFSAYVCQRDFAKSRGRILGILELAVRLKYSQLDIAMVHKIGGSASGTLQMHERSELTSEVLHYG